MRKLPNNIQKEVLAMTIKKLLRPQILFPAVILILLVIALVFTVAVPSKPGFRAVKTDQPGFSMTSWADVDEARFYERMAIAVYAHVKEEPQYYTHYVPSGDGNNDDRVAGVCVYQADVASVLAQPCHLPAEERSTIPVHSIPSAFSDARVTSGGSYLFFLADMRDVPDFEPDETVSPSYYDDYAKTFGYALITPRVSVFRAEPYGDTMRVKTSHLPEYLRGEGEYMTFEELRDILAEGRQRFRPDAAQNAA